MPAMNGEPRNICMKQQHQISRDPGATHIYDNRDIGVQGMPSPINPLFFPIKIIESPKKYGDKSGHLSIFALHK